MCVKAFHLSCQGASHIRHNKECQDASTSYEHESCAIAIVCDGHGGDDYVRSAIGAEFACKAAQDSLEVFLRKVDKHTFRLNEKERTAQIARLEGSIISAWNTSIRSHYTQNPFTEAELACLSSKAQARYLQKGEIENAYGTTLLAVALTPDFWFGLQIGDGKCVAVDRVGAFTQPIPWDEKCFLNATTSICDNRAIENFRHFYGEELPAAVFVGTDGIDDSFSGENRFYDFYKTVLYSFTVSDFDTAVAELGEYLPRLSAKGSGDDVSIAGILDLEQICGLDLQKDFAGTREPAQADFSEEAVVDEVEIHERQE